MVRNRLPQAQVVDAIVSELFWLDLVVTRLHFSCRCDKIFIARDDSASERGWKDDVSFLSRGTVGRILLVNVFALNWRYPQRG